jgi:hypothetical protein
MILENDPFLKALSPPLLAVAALAAAFGRTLNQTRTSEETKNFRTNGPMQDSLQAMHRLLEDCPGLDTTDARNLLQSVNRLLNEAPKIS